MVRVLVMLVALVTIETAAHAQETKLASGPIFGGPTQTEAFCIIFNSGHERIVFDSPKIFEEDTAAPVTLTANDCLDRFRSASGKVSLPPGAICDVEFSPLKNNLSYACKGSFQELTLAGFGPAPRTRGTFEICGPGLLGLLPGPPLARADLL